MKQVRRAGSEYIIPSLPPGQVVAARFTKNQMEVQRSQTRTKGRGPGLQAGVSDFPEERFRIGAACRIVTLSRTVTLSWAEGPSGMPPALLQKAGSQLRLGKKIPFLNF